ncbi:E3 ubiquitin-protein ligase RNF25 [Venturia canescens]|uniref:E3 ubiquitin-protein ligase RNF25 n=1 Tax=Venturia canescens TaxID=32260 RepID=UPI001C9C142E|nr:E3 ubiquitin-protein ligase RNF25 [Venturia canescens]
MSDMTDERVADEIEALKAILLDDELTIGKNATGEAEYIETLVFPSTGEDSQSQYVCLRLLVHLHTGYPDVSPTVSLKNPRGLHEDTLHLIQTEAEAKCQDFIGQPVMFELIELVREHLTRSNLPTGQCAVCLYGFREGDEFTKTECYHHFHSHCLAAHVAASERYYREEKEKLPHWQQDSTKDFQAICPVCREPINCNVDALWSAPPPIDVEAASDFSVSTELRDLQRRMSVLFSHQQQRGGIIDLEAEGVKMLLRTEEETTAGIPGPSPNAIAQNSVNNTARYHHHYGAHNHRLGDSKNSSGHQQQRQREQIQQQTDNSQTHNHMDSHQSQNNNSSQSNHYRRRNRGRGGRSTNRRYSERARQAESTPR